MSKLYIRTREISGGRSVDVAHRLGLKAPDIDIVRLNGVYMSMSVFAENLVGDQYKCCDMPIYSSQMLSECTWIDPEVLAVTWRDFSVGGHEILNIAELMRDVRPHYKLVGRHLELQFDLDKNLESASKKTAHLLTDQDGVERELEYVVIRRGMTLEEFHEENGKAEDDEQD